LQKARLTQAEIELEKLTVCAPFAGVVTDLYVEIGEWAGPSKPLLRLLDLNDIYIRAELDEVDIGRIRAGLPVRVTLDPYKDRIWSGTITRVAPHVSEILEQSRTVEIEVKLTGGIDGEELMPGTSADVEVILDQTPPDVLRVPTLALMEGKRVLVLEKRTARAVEVKIGLRNWDYTEVVEGLSEGAAVIVSLDKQEVRDGARVVEEKPKP